MRLTMVAGAIVCRDGNLLKVGKAALKAEARTIMETHRADRATAAADADRLHPRCRTMHLKAAADFSMTRWAHPKGL
jgi:hypothetical protein